MPIAYCKRCHRLFNKGRRDLCPNCVEEQEQVFQTVRAYLKQNPLANLMEVAEGTGVDPNDVVDLIREGLLLVRDNPNLNYPCERCGAPTQAGRYCTKCAEELTAALQSAREDLTKRAGQDRRGYFSR